MSGLVWSLGREVSVSVSWCLVGKSQNCMFVTGPVEKIAKLHIDPSTCRMCIARNKVIHEHFKFEYHFQCTVTIFCSVTAFGVCNTIAIQVAIFSTMAAALSFLIIHFQQWDFARYGLLLQQYSNLPIVYLACESLLKWQQDSWHIWYVMTGLDLWSHFGNILIFSSHIHYLTMITGIIISTCIN